MQEVIFRVTHVHHNAFPDGHYRITPELNSNWGNPVTPVSRGIRHIEPVFWNVVLKPEALIVSVYFEVMWLPNLSQAEWQTERS
jgi:hypothetical protein